MKFGKFVENIKTFLSDVKIETKKTTFPSREETIHTTMVVVVLVLIATLYMWILNVVFSVTITKILP